MNKIYNISNLTNLTLEDFELEFPKSINKNSFFTKIKYLGNDLVIQGPKCLTKEGIQNNNNKFTCNLKYELTDKDHKQMIEFLDNFRNLCKKLIFSKNNSWFQDSLEEKNLDFMFSNPLKHNNNKSVYFLKLHLEKNFTTYDEKQNECSIDDINNTTSLIPLININGIIFNETNFNLDLCSSQIMYFNNKEARCLIKLQQENTNNLEKSSTNDLEENKTIDLEKSIDNTNSLEKNKEPTNNEIIEEPELEEYNLDNIVNLEESIKLKNPNDLYYELYNLAKKKAKLAKREALNAYLELQKIKEQYNLDVSDSDEELSDDESIEREKETNMNNNFDNISSTNSEISELSELSELSDFSENFDENNK